MATIVQWIHRHLSTFGPRVQIPITTSMLFRFTYLVEIFTLFVFRPRKEWRRGLDWRILKKLSDIWNQVYLEFQTKPVTKLFKNYILAECTLPSEYAVCLALFYIVLSHTFTDRLIDWFTDRLIDSLGGIIKLLQIAQFSPYIDR